ncbi:hypothetical protein CVT26_002634 [Gymnopilus dilepis]|uniref:DUF6818 domain-containing protein n=1 Tax=Gymnopilus dilepis TaxID=231916 RepID=A0A409VCK9_9AGAR|nr:hypothetical protein CVT26_002634 [Gymnopilus dilepis]
MSLPNAPATPAPPHLMAAEPQQNVPQNFAGQDGFVFPPHQMHHPLVYPPGHPAQYFYPMQGPNDAAMGPPRPPYHPAQPIPMAPAPAVPLDPKLAPNEGDDDDDDDDDDELPPAHEIMARMRAKPVAKTAGRRRAVQSDPKGKGKQPAVAPAVNARKRKARGSGEQEEPVAKRGRQSGRQAVGAEEDEAPTKSRRGGRQPGALKFMDDEIEALLELVAAYLPTGGKGWTKVHEEYADWAAAEGKPLRTLASLERKFKNLVGQKKPTGNPNISAAIERAIQIDLEITNKVETRELDDSELVDVDDAIEISSDDEEQEEEEEEVEDDDEEAPLNKEAPPAKGVPSPKDAPPPPKSATAPTTGKKDLSASAPAKSAKEEPTKYSVGLSRKFVAERTPATRTKPKTQGYELLQSIQTALDPSTQFAREEERSARSFANTQLLTITQTLRSTQTSLDTLHHRLQQAENARHEALRQRDMLELELKLLKEGSGRRNHSTPPRLDRISRWDRTPDRPSRSRLNETPFPDRYHAYPYSPTASSRRHRDPPAAPRCDRRLVRVQNFDRDGGHCTAWVSDFNELPDDFRSTPEPGTVRLSSMASPTCSPNAREDSPTVIVPPVSVDGVLTASAPVDEADPSSSTRDD